MHLAEDGGDTILTYTVKAQVGGKLAQLGSRLIDSTARKMADEFFGNFSQMVAGNAAATGTAEDGEPDAGTLEEARSIAMEQAGDAVVHAVEDVEKTIGHAVHEAEETVEAAAVKGSFGGPVVWGLAALAAIIVILAIMSR